MATILAEAGVRISAITDDLRRDLRRDLNTALRDVKVDTAPLQDLERAVRRTNLELIKARESASAAAREASDAEADLARLRADSESSADDIRAAEGRLTRTRAEAAVAVDKVAAAEQKLNQQSQRRLELLRGTEQQERRTTETTAAHARVTVDLSRSLSLLPNPLDAARRGTTIFGTSLRFMSTAALVSLGSVGALAGAGGLLGLASAAATAAGSVALVPAALSFFAAGVATLTVGLQGVGDALKVMDDATKFAEAAKDLSPAARAFVTEVRRLRPAARELRLAVQEQLFDDLARDLRSVAEIYLPLLRNGLSGVADSLNRGGQGFVAFARQGRTVGDVANMFRNARLAGNELAEAVQPILEGLRDIGAVGSEFLPGLATGFRTAAVDFRAFIAEARASGALKETIADGLEALRDFGRLLGNIGGILGGVLNAGEAAGASLLKTLVSLTDELDEFVNSAEGQTALTSFFTAAKDAAKVLGPILREIVNLVGNDLAPVLADIAVAVGPSVVTILKSLGEAVRLASPGITAMAEGFAAFLEGIAPALPALGELARVVGEGLGDAFAELGPVLGDVVVALAHELKDALPTLIPALVAVASAALRLLEAAAPLIGPLSELATVILVAFADVAEDLAPVIAEIARELGETLGPILPELAQAMGEFGKEIAPIAGDLGKALVDFLRAVLPLVPPLISLMRILLLPMKLVVAAMSGLVAGGAAFVEFLTSVVGGIGDFMGTVAKSATEFTEYVANGFEAPLRSLDGNMGEILDRAEGRLKSATGGMGSSLSELGVHFGETTGVIGNEFRRQELSSSIWLVNFSRNMRSGEREGRNSVFGVLSAMVAAKNVSGAHGTGTGRAWATGLAIGGAAGKVRAARLVADVNSILSGGRGRAGSAGSAVANAFADGVNSPAARAKAVRAAASLVAAVAAFFPSSPALRGPFSGRGWTVHRGAALVEGFETGMLSQLADLNRSTLRVMNTVDEGLHPLALPALRVGSDGAQVPTARGRDTADLEAAIERAMTKMAVVVSSREVASQVKRVDAENRGR